MSFRTRSIDRDVPATWSEAVGEAAALLRRGGVVAAPTETVYGLMTRWADAAGSDRIFRMKDRPREKRLQMLAPDLAAARRCGILVGKPLQRLADAFWPGPLTVVVPARDGETVGVRIPDHAFLQALLRAVPFPLAATSANRSGSPPALDASSALSGLCAPPDLLVDGGGIARGTGQASTVVSLVCRPPRVLRSGPVSSQRLRDVLGELSDGSEPGSRETEAP